MKILILSDGFLPIIKGGAEQVVFNLAKSFQEKGHQVFIISTRQDKLLPEEEIYRGLKIFRIYSNYHEHWRGYLSIYNPQTVKKVEKIIKEVKPDVVHAHNIHYYLSYYCLKIAKKNSRAVFLTAHDVMLFHYGKLVEFINPNDLSIPKTFNYRITPWQQIKRFKKRYNPFRNIIIRHYLKYVDKIFAVSHTLKEALNHNKIKNIEVIHNGTDIDKWQVDNNKLRNFKKKYNLFNKKIIFFCGRLNYWKGGENILRAMKIVVNQIPDSILLIAGTTDNYIQRMLEIAEKQDLPLILTDWLEKDELKAAYFSSDIVVTPSLCLDTFNMINLEAMACQKPVIGTCFGGTAEIVVDNQTGYLINPLDIQIMAERIIDLLKSPDKAEQFGEAGYQKAKKKFSLVKQVRQYLNWFEKYI